MIEKYYERKRAIELRLRGLSYKEIRKIVDVSKGSLSTWLKDIKLSEFQKQRLDKKQKDNQIEFIIYARTSNKKLEWSSLGGTNTIKNFKSKVVKNLIPSNELANFAYRKDELPIKEQLEKITGLEFKKEYIDGYFVDFSDENYLIEHTTDSTKGVSDAIDRLNNITSNKIKVIITHVDKLGELRLSRCNKINLLDIDDFWNGKFI